MMSKILKIKHLLQHWSCGTLHALKSRKGPRWREFHCLAALDIWCRLSVGFWPLCAPFALINHRSWDMGRDSVFIFCDFDMVRSILPVWNFCFQPKAATSDLDDEMSANGTFCKFCTTNRHQICKPLFLSSWFDPCFTLAQQFLNFIIVCYRHGSPFGVISGVCLWCRKVWKSNIWSQIEAVARYKP